MQHRRQVNNMHKHKDKKKIESKKSNNPHKINATTLTHSRDESRETEDGNALFSKRTLTTNWSKYEEADPIDDNEQLCAADFENLLVTPASSGSHFVFSTERNWETNVDATAHYFKLNMSDLARNLSSLPFYVRQGYATELFDSTELRDMDTKARKMQQTVRKDSNTLLTKLPQKPIQKERVSAGILSPLASSAPGNITHTSTTLQAEADELDALLEFTMPPQLSAVPMEAFQNLKIVNNTPPIAPNTTDIQQWLDDIFDE